MRLKEGLVLEEVCGEYILILVGKENVDFSNIVNFNESSALIWKAIHGKEFTLEDMQKILLDNYEVEEQEALSDCEELINQWKNLDFIV